MSQGELDQVESRDMISHINAGVAERLDTVADLVSACFNLPNTKQDGCERCDACWGSISEVLALSVDNSLFESIYYANIEKLLAIPKHFDNILRSVLEKERTRDGSRIRADVFATLREIFKKNEKSFWAWEKGSKTENPLPHVRLLACLTRKPTSGERSLIDTLQSLDLSTPTGDFVNGVNTAKTMLGEWAESKFNDSIDDLPFQWRCSNCASEFTRTGKKRVAGGGSIQLRTRRGEVSTEMEGRVIDFSMRHILAIVGFHINPNDALYASVCLRGGELPIEMVLNTTQRPLLGDPRPSLSALTGNKYGRYVLFTIGKVEDALFYHCVLCLYLRSKRRTSDEERFLDRYNVGST